MSSHTISTLMRAYTRACISAARQRQPFGYFGAYGGRYVGEVLHAPLAELQDAFLSLENNDNFWNDFTDILINYVGRPTPLYYARNITESIRKKNSSRGARVFIKLEGFAHTGAHKINNAIGQALLAKRLGKTRIIAETGAGQHGVATATACAKLGMECHIYMGSIDVRRQRPNVHVMRMLGADVISVHSGQQILKDAINEAMRDWSANFSDTHYVIGSALGPSPFPDMAQCFQSVIGAELVAQIAEQHITPAAIVACVGGGSNAIGFFTPFLPDIAEQIKHEKTIKGVSLDIAPQLHAAEAGGYGAGLGQHASRLAHNTTSRESVVHGYKSMFLANDEGQLEHTYSISAGLDYPGVGPRLAHLAREGFLNCARVEDSQALDALEMFARHEGVLFALESAHAGALGVELARKMSCDEDVIINMSGRGDKDLFITAPARDSDEWITFLRDEATRLEQNSQQQTPIL